MLEKSVYSINLLVRGRGLCFCWGWGRVQHCYRNSAYFKSKNPGEKSQEKNHRKSQVKKKLTKRRKEVAEISHREKITKKVF